MDARDYYALLGVSRDADGTMIKQSFHARARLLHSDVSEDPDAEGKFRELADAYSVLSKPASRLLYDRFGYCGRGADPGPHSGAAQAVSGLLEFCARSRRRSQRVGAAAEIELEFFEAARGGLRRVRYVSSASCDACGGSGRLVNEPCGQCDGAGECEAEREAEVAIHSGVEDGASLPLEDGADSPYVVVRVRPQPPDSVLLRAAAAVGLLVALGFLVFLLAS